MAFIAELSLLAADAISRESAAIDWLAMLSRCAIRFHIYMLIGYLIWIDYRQSTAIERLTALLSSDAPSVISLHSITSAS